MRESARLNESLKLQLNASQSQSIIDSDVAANKLHNAEQELRELRQELELQQQQHQVKSSYFWQ